MSYLESLIGEARNFIDAYNKQATGHKDAVVHDTFDQRMWEQLKTEVPRLGQVTEDLRREWNYADDLMRDTVLQFFKAEPQIRKADDMDERYTLNQAVAEDIAAMQETAITRTYTMADPYGAVMASLGINEVVKEFMAKHKELQEAQQEEEGQGCNLGGCVGGLESALPGDGGIDLNKLSDEEKAALQKQIEDLLKKAREAQAKHDQAKAQLKQQSTQAAGTMRRAIVQSVEKTGDQLDEEEALFRAWGIEEGEATRMSFEERAKQAALLKNNRFAKFSDLIGRFRLRAVAERSRKTDYGRDEIVDVEMSDDLPRVLNSEFAMSRHRALRLDFLSRYAEKKLLSHKYIGVENLGKGAIIACIDTSGSMAGEPEVWAKAFALALLDQARSQKRDFVCINFSSYHQVKTFRFPEGKFTTPELLEMMELMWNGGTSYESPLNHAMEELTIQADSGRMKGDIVFITDGSCGVGEQWMAEYLEKKEKMDFRTFGVFIGQDDYLEHCSALKAISDNVRSIQEFADPGVVADILRAV